MVGDSSTRTVPIKLDVDESAANLLHQTTDHFLDAANYVVDVAWKPTGKSPANRNSTTKRTTMFETNHRSRPTSCKPHATEPQKPSKAVSNAGRKAKKASKPHFTSRFASYDARTGTVNDDHATLATIDGRVTADFILPDERRDTPHSAYLFNDDYDVNGATLHYDEVEDCFYLHVRTKPAVENDEAEQGDAKHVSVLGVDLGITNIATTSTGRFWSGGELNHWHREYEAPGRPPTNRDSMGTRECSAGRSQSKLGASRQFLHTISNELVKEALENDCTHIVFEQLKGVWRTPSSREGCSQVGVPPTLRVRHVQKPSLKGLK